MTISAGSNIALSEAGNTITIAATDTDDQTLSEILAVSTSAGTHKITEVTDPTADQDAATKKYVDTQVSGVSTHDAVTIGTANGLSLSGQEISLDAATTTTPGALSAADKTKLDGIATGAEVNVNADWDASSGDAQILNKPDLSGYLTSETDGSVTNEGSLTVEAGTATTSLISSNTSGSTDVTISAGSNISLSETDNTITIAATDTDDQTLSEILAVSTSAGTHKITEVTDPTADQDAATKKYVDTQVSGVSTHDAVTIGTANGLSLSGQEVSLDAATTTTPGALSAADKTKLDGIATGAEVNVNADWDASSGDAQILNKPTLATVATSGSYNDLSDKPTSFTPDAHTLDSHSNVTITENSNGEILKWNGTAWVNNTIAEAGIQPAGSYLTAEIDGSITNEGSLTVGAGTATTSLISSNTSGSTDVTISAGSNIALSEAGNTITIAATDTDDQTLSEILAVSTSAGTHKITEVTDPTADQDAATKKYVDTQVSGVSTHDAVTIGTANGLSLSGQEISLDAATTTTPGALSAADKTKLDGIATGAEVNVNADWDASSGDAQILNKPDLSGYLTSETDGSVTNEGSLTVGAGTATTSLISSNTSGSTDVTISAGSNISLSETGNTITIAATDTDDQTATEVSITDSGDHFSSTDVEGALGELATEIDAKGTGTVTSVSSATTDQITVANGTTTPAISAVTAAVANNGTALATGDQIYDFVTTQGYLTSETDGSVTNEGSLTVGAGTATTSLISSNTSGSTDVTISAGSNISLSETDNTITIAATDTDDQTLSEILAVSTSAGTHKITDVTDPTADQDAATKKYVDTQVAGALDFENGITNTSDTVKLGGALTGNTEIIQDEAETLTFTNSGTGNTIINLANSGDFDIQDNGTSALFVGDNGNVGIGNIAPQAKIHIDKDATYNSENTYALKIEDGSDEVGLLLGVSTSVGAALIQSLDPGTSYATRPLALNPVGGNVGIGTTSPENLLTVQGTGSMLITANRYGNSPNIGLVRLNGTELTPTTVVTDDAIGRYRWGGYDGSAMKNNAAQIESMATQDWTASAHGTNMQFSTTTNDDINPSVKMTIENDGESGYWYIDTRF